MAEGRFTDESLMKCEDCGWRGFLKDCIPTYRGIPLTEDVEAVDLCPKCESRKLIHLWGDFVLV